MPSIFGCLHATALNLDEITQTMYEALGNRGGDSQAIHRDQRIALGVRGNANYVRQTLVMNPTKTIIAVIEGEIYNLEDIRRLLGRDAPPSQEPHAFDVLIALYEKFGKDFPNYLNGIFAIALWDSQQDTLYLVRDHVGSRSLFYAQHGENLFFASTIHALLKTGNINREISLTAMHAYFASTAIYAPHTMFTQISCLRPGSMVIYKNGHCAEHEYWQLKNIAEDVNRPENEFVEEVRSLILDAIKIRANYGETYGSLLSGGVDTSIIAATLSANFSSEKKLPSFSITFAEEFYNDAKLQDIMYQRYPLAQHTTTVTAQEFADILRKGVAHLDKPVNDNAFVGMYKAFELAKQTGCSAVFDGEAADELFFTGHAHGENSFQKFLILPLWVRRAVLHTLIPSIPLGDSLWKKGRRLLYKIGLSNEERTLSRLPSFYNHATSILANPISDDPHAIGKAYLSETVPRDPLNYYHYGIFKTFLADDLLFKNERMASAHGIFNRTPFIDYRLVELAFKIPSKYKITQPTPENDGTKMIYKKAIHGLIPNEILYRKKKRGFSQPSSVWYRRELKDFVYDSLFSQDSLCTTYLNTTYMLRLFSEHASGQANFDYLLSSLLIFEHWLRAFSKGNS